MALDFERHGGSMRRADRLLHLVELLRHNRYLPVQALADRLEVARRTVYRDLDELEARGVRIKMLTGLGYALDRQALLPPLRLDDDEAEAVVIGARMAAAWADPTLGAAAHGALEKIEAILPDASAAVLEHIRLFAPSGPWADAMRDGLGPVRHAIAHRRKLAFVYRREDGRSGHRTARPLGLHFWGAVWTLAAWCERRAAYRTFRVDRMSKIETLDESWASAEGTDLNGYLAEKATDEALVGVEGLGRTA